MLTTFATKSSYLSQFTFQRERNTHCFLVRFFLYGCPKSDKMYRLLLQVIFFIRSYQILSYFSVWVFFLFFLYVFMFCQILYVFLNVMILSTAISSYRYLIQDTWYQHSGCHYVWMNIGEYELH